MPKISGKLKSNPNKTNNLIYIMIYLQGGVKKKFFIFFYPPPILNPETALATFSQVVGVRSSFTLLSVRTVHNAIAYINVVGC